MLLGATKDNELVFAEFGVSNRSGYDEFTASFDTVRPFDGDSVDISYYYQCIVDDMDKDWLIDKCDEYDCKPSDLAEKMADNCYDITEVVDCSLYPETYIINNADWYFESMCCGQHDTRDDMAEYVDEKAYNELHELWDKYHLHKVDSGVIDKVRQIADALSKTNAEEWITDYVRRHIDELR